MDDPNMDVASTGAAPWWRHLVLLWRDVSTVRRGIMSGDATMEISLRRLRRYEFCALAIFVAVGIMGIVLIERDAALVAKAAETASEAQTESAVLWQLAALDPRSPNDAERFAGALKQLTLHQASLEAATQSREAPSVLRDLMEGQSYTLADRMADLIALGTRLTVPGLADETDHRLLEFRHEIADGLAPKVDLAGQLFTAWAHDRAESHSRAIAWTSGIILALAVLLALAFVPFEYRLRRGITMLEWLAARDALTGTLTRGAFLARLTPMLAKARDSASVGLIRFDIDDFRALNAKSGDDAGDAMLHAVGSRLKIAVGKGALVGRLGSDTFVVALPGLAEGQTGLINEAIRLSQVVSQPMAYGGQLPRISVSGGVALAPKDSRDRSELMRMAEIAMQDAKRSGKGRVMAYRTSETKAHARREAVLAALAKGDFRGLEPWFQPIVACKDGSAVSLEVLSRWHHPRLGQILPREFLPIAEAMGKLPRVSSEVRNAAFVALAEIDRTLGAQTARLGLSINLSPVELLTPEAVPAMSAALQATNIEMSRLSVELTEEVLAGGGVPVAQKNLQSLRLSGAALYLDNFGTGFASLSNLYEFPLDALKIDRAFISGIGQSAKAEAIVRGVIGLAHGLGIIAVAQGVETAAAWDFLRDANCDYAQGYFIAPPMSFRTTLAWLGDQTRSQRAG